MRVFGGFGDVAFDAVYGGDFAFDGVVGGGDRTVGGAMFAHCWACLGGCVAWKEGGCGVLGLGSVRGGGGLFLGIVFRGAYCEVVVCHFEFSIEWLLVD